MFGMSLEFLRRLEGHFCVGFVDSGGGIGLYRKMYNLESIFNYKIRILCENLVKKYL